MGMPVASNPAGVDDWRQGMRALAANTHVVTKISGVGFIDRRWTVEQIRPLVLETIEIFGADRCLFASDFPTDKLFGSFDRHMEAYHAIVRSEEHTSELQSLMRISYAVFCLKKKKRQNKQTISIDEINEAQEV